jgi:signal transduction histidine kinase
VPVDLERRGSTAEVTEAVGCAAFRIVQESLTNVMRHAGPARVTVVIERTPTALRVHVVDDGRGVAAVTEVEGLRPGHGISGMHERAQAVGGTVAAGPRPGGGFTVEAHLPVTAHEDDPVGGDRADGSPDHPPAESRAAEPRAVDSRGVRA